MAFPAGSRHEASHGDRLSFGQPTGAKNRSNMQTQFDIHEAETHFFRLIEQVEAGGEVVITRAGQPVVRLVRIGEAPKRRVLGRLEGHFRTI